LDIHGEIFLNWILIILDLFSKTKKSLNNQNERDVLVIKNL